MQTLSVAPQSSASDFTPAVLDQTYLRLSDVAKRYRCSGSTVWNWCRVNKLPQPIKLGAGTTLWRMQDLLQWEAAKIAENSSKGV